MVRLPPEIYVAIQRDPRTVTKPVVGFAFAGPPHFKSKRVRKAQDREETRKCGLTLRSRNWKMLSVLTSARYETNADLKLLSTCTDLYAMPFIIPALVGAAITKATTKKEEKIAVNGREKKDGTRAKAHLRTKKK
jgi:hypothetical protein